MASINDKTIVDNIISNNGVYISGDEADPPVFAIIEYGNIFDGRATYALTYTEKEFDHVYETVACRWKKVLWITPDSRRKIDSSPM